LFVAFDTIQGLPLVMPVKWALLAFLVNLRDDGAYAINPLVCEIAMSSGKHSFKAPKRPA
jgi:hypothetical protein